MTSAASPASGLPILLPLQRGSQPYFAIIGGVLRIVKVVIVVVVWIHRRPLRLVLQYLVQVVARAALLPEHRLAAVPLPAAVHVRAPDVRLPELSVPLG